MCLLTDFIDEGSLRFECAIVGPRVSTALSLGKGGATPESVDIFFAGPHFFDATLIIYLLVAIYSWYHLQLRVWADLIPKGFKSAQ